MRLSLAAVAALMMVTATTGRAAEPRSPTGKWVVEFADNMCVLQRDYGSKERPLRLVLRPMPLSNQMGMGIISRPRNDTPLVVPVKIGFGPGTEPVRKQLESFDLNSISARYNSTGLKREELERALPIGELTIDGHYMVNTSLAVPALGNALKVLDACMVDLLETWGVSKADQMRMAAPAEPVGGPEGLLRSEDYPRPAVYRNESGNNSARVTIDAAGNPSKCVIVESSKSADLDGTLCNALLRARYKPAVDKAAQPMVSLYFARVSWRAHG
jgi:TonB family protein